MVGKSGTRNGSTSLLVRGGMAVVVAVVLNVIIVFVSGSLNIAPGFQPLSVPPVVFLTAAGAVGATVVYGLLGRFVDDVNRAFVRIAGVVLLLSFVPDIGLLVADPAATVPGVVVLMVMHVIVAGVAVGALVYWDQA